MYKCNMTVILSFKCKKLIATALFSCSITRYCTVDTVEPTIKSSEKKAENPVWV